MVKREHGVLVLSVDAESIRPEYLGVADYVSHYARSHPDHMAVRQRDGDIWREISWSMLTEQMLSVATGLLKAGVEFQRPILALSGNSIELFVLLMAADYVGIPVAAVSPAYSIKAKDFSKLQGFSELLNPQLIFADSFERYGKAIEALESSNAQVLTVTGSKGLIWNEIIHTEVDPHLIAQSRERIQIESVARIFFTSGSTGMPKAVPLTYRNVQATIGQCLYLHTDLFKEERPVLLDWMPWSHAAGGLWGIVRTTVLGGDLHIDDGRPVPEEFDLTLRNLREVSPSIMGMAPVAWTMLAPALESDAALARTFFHRLKYCVFGSASLPRSVWERIQRVAEKTVGERMVLCSGYGSTETSAIGSFFSGFTDDVSNVGTPVPGSELKLVPLPSGEGRYEVRMRGDHVFAGYLNRPDLTDEAFDEEGFFSLGDALTLVDPDDPDLGLMFAGRIGEDFKLVTGSWVRTGAARLQLLEACSPLVRDAVICGHDRDFVAAMAWPNVANCRQLHDDLAHIPIDQLCRHPRLIEELVRKLAKQSGSTSARISRLLLLADPPENAEISEKGYVNQAAVRIRRHKLVDILYQSQPEPFVAVENHEH